MKHFYTFSEAIRAGIPMVGQGFYAFFDGPTACAIGTGAIAIHGRKEIEVQEVQDVLDEALSLYPYLSKYCDLPCPAGCPAEGTSIRRVLMHLNDNHRWSREEICDWLEREEEKLGYLTVVEAEKSEVSFINHGEVLTV